MSCIRTRLDQSNGPDARFIPVSPNDHDETRDHGPNALETGTDAPARSFYEEKSELGQEGLA